MSEELPPPAWLAEEPGIQALLAAVLDRFDRQPGDSREKAIVLSALPQLPALDRNDAGADQIWAFVNQLVRAGVLEIRAGRRGPYDPPWHGAKLAFPPASENILRAWLGRAAVESATLTWRRAVEEQAHRFPGGVTALAARRIPIEGRTPAQVVDAFAHLGELTQSYTLRQLSALCFWGDSKVLDDRAELVATLFPQLQIRERPIVVAAHLPATMSAVLFIENQDTYTTACDGVPAAVGDHALVYIAGFRGTASRIRNRDGARLHFAGPGLDTKRESFEGWWFAGQAHALPTFFWGDLDFSGMQILKSLRARFANTAAWKPGYTPMLASVAARTDCVDSSDAHRQIDPLTTGCAFADNELLPAIRSHGFLHQEHPGGR